MQEFNDFYFNIAVILTAPIMLTLVLGGTIQGLERLKQWL